MLLLRHGRRLLDNFLFGLAAGEERHIYDVYILVVYIMGKVNVEMV
jgi:hypothetical protein